MKHIFFLFFCISSINLFGQESKSYELTKDSDTLYYSKYDKPILEKLKLINPEKNKNFFRFSSSKYYLELSDESNKYLIYADEIWDSKKTGETFIKQIDLTKSQINEIKKLIDSLKINEIPSDKQIEKWKFGFDGITYSIEFKNEKTYSYKHYWTPTSQDKFNESDLINFFVTEIDRIIEYQKNREKFITEVPYFSWTRDGVSWSAATILNNKNYSEYKKYRRLKKKQLRKKERKKLTIYNISLVN
ncbi:hypothetical protein [Chryseobacterium gwangjuense]|uniref:hypothetical protein n=1 Tax=Chryseobacterium gwangjuense TaxID=1069980 RepID=UPI001E43A7CA|nr:hypothetical protein [Chryseobacterium gwangjuense]MCE3074298.1 hypothetical protein [Chryseobacterium gwangjuense]